MKLILQSIKTLLRKYVRTVNGIAPDRTGNVEIKSDKWHSYDLVIRLSNKGTSLDSITNDTLCLIKGNFESIKKALLDSSELLVYIYAIDRSFREYELSYLVYDDEDEEIEVHIVTGTDKTSRLYLHSDNTMGLQSGEW